MRLMQKHLDKALEEHKRIALVSVILLVFILAVLPTNIFSHETTEKHEEPTYFTPVDSLFVTTYIIAVVLIGYIIFKRRIGEKGKKAAFLMITIPVLFSTAYLIIDTIQLILASESGGVVHWHADFTIEICGERQLISEPEHLESKVGSSYLHHHNEGKNLNGVYRIHIEGIVKKLEDVDLGSFFDVIGGRLTENSLTIPLITGETRTVTNGDICPNTGKPGELKVIVNGKEISNPENYVISPYQNVPPGDIIQIIFE